MSSKGRIWILLIAWVLFIGFCWADTFDLSDDIVLPTTVGQPLVAVESMEDRPDALILDIFVGSGELVPLPFLFVSDLSPDFTVPDSATDIPLYQRYSVYRI